MTHSIDATFPESKISAAFLELAEPILKRGRRRRRID
jgi:hypothetical protein